jgi:hypothetical protein
LGDNLAGRQGYGGRDLNQDDGEREKKAKAGSGTHRTTLFRRGDDDLGTMIVRVRGKRYA